MYIWPWIIEHIFWGSKFIFLASFYGMIVLFFVWYAITRNKPVSPIAENVILGFYIIFITLFLDGLGQLDSANWKECISTPAVVQYMDYKYENYPLTICRSRTNTNHPFGMWKIQ